MKQPAPDLVVAGKYCLDGQLASGGMGSVWVAKHIDLGVPVAIKFMGPEVAASEEGRIRFEREAKAAAFLQSPHVVNVQDYGVDDGLAYIVMELLIGEDLEDRIHRVGRLPPEDVLQILRQASRALRRAQDLGIVHRDIKPQNLFIAQSDDGEETVKILDFGIAKETGPTLLAQGTNTGQIIGSPHYMSPEAVRGVRDVDHRSDLWSMAVIVFQALTGKLPFDSEIIGDVMGKILADPLPVATDIAPDLPPEIDEFFHKALARDRNQRFQTAREMTEAFAQIVHGPISESLESSRPPPVVISASSRPPAPDSAQPSSPVKAAPAAAPESGPVITTAAPAEPARSTLPSASNIGAKADRSRPLRNAIAATAALLVIGVASLLVVRSTGQSGAANTASPSENAAAAQPVSSTSAAAAASSESAPAGAPGSPTSSATPSGAPVNTPPSTEPSAGAGGAQGTASSSGKPAQASRQTSWRGAAAPKTPDKKPKKSWGF